MNLNLTGHQLPITPAIREYIASKLQRITHHFDNVIDVNVIMSVEKLQQKIEATIISVKNGPEAIALLESGNADGFASDKLLLVGAKFKSPDAFMMLPDDLSVEPYGIGLPRGDWAFRLAVNTGLAQVYRSGTILNLFAGWFSQIGLQMSPVMRVVYGLGALSD